MYLRCIQGSKGGGTLETFATIYIKTKETALLSLPINIGFQDSSYVIDSTRFSSIVDGEGYHFASVNVQSLGTYTVVCGNAIPQEITITNFNEVFEAELNLELYIVKDGQPTEYFTGTSIKRWTSSAGGNPIAQFGYDGKCRYYDSAGLSWDAMTTDKAIPFSLYSKLIIVDYSPVSGGMEIMYVKDQTGTLDKLGVDTIGKPTAGYNEILIPEGAKNGQYLLAFFARANGNGGMFKDMYLTN